MVRAGFLFTLVVSVPLFLALGCGRTPSEPDAVGLPDPNPDGMFLEGNPTDNAVGATRVLPPSPVPPADIVNGLFTTRLDAILGPQATVGEVNALMDLHDVRIVSMMPRDMFVTLKISPVQNESEAQTLIDLLTADRVFLDAVTVFELLPPDLDAFSVSTPHSGLAPQVFPPGGNTMLAHLNAIGMPAAWNAAGLASNKIRVLVSDSYYQLEPHDEIDAMTFPGTAAGREQTSVSATSYAGNHGFHVVGTIAANFDDSGPTGVSPDPTDLLNVVCLPGGGLSWNDRFNDMVNHFPAMGNFVINTSIGYKTEAPIGAGNKKWRVLQAMKWRGLASQHKGRYVHATSAGNNYDNFPSNDAGNAKWNSPWCVARSFADLTQAFDLGALSSTDSFVVATTWATVTTLHPTAAEAMTNTIMVGSSNTEGTESAFSNRDSDVRVVGESVISTCIKQDPGSSTNRCDGSLATKSGTSMATPQIAGLAAYLWNLKSSLSSEDIVGAIKDAYSSSEGLVDAYKAVLSLDPSIADTKIRQAILDVAGSSVDDGPNGVFNDVDIEKFLKEWEENDGPERFSRYDLTGKWCEFDLNADGDIGVVDQFVETDARNFEESCVSSGSVLCYYAWSPMFGGSEQRRRELLATCIPRDCLKSSVRISRQVLTSTGENCLEDPYIEGTTFPLSMQSEGTCTMEDGSFDMTNLATTDFWAAHCRSTVTGSGGNSPRSRAISRVTVWDSLLVTHPDLEGVESAIRIRVRIEGDMTFSSGAWSDLDYTLYAGGMGVIDVHQVVSHNFPEGYPDGRYIPPVDTTSVPIDFVYGRPLGFGFDLSATAGSFNSGTSLCDLTARILDITGLPEGAKVQFTCSGKEWGALGP